MSDLISRQAAIKAVEDLRDCYNGFSDTYDKACIIGVLEELPSAQPERGEGRWIDLDSDTEKYDDVMCSNCKQIFMVDAHRWCDIGFTVDDLKFCPNCGAKMGGNDNADV